MSQIEADIVKYFRKKDDWNDPQSDEESDTGPVEETKNTVPDENEVSFYHIDPSAVANHIYALIHGRKKWFL